MSMIITDNMMQAMEVESMGMIQQRHGSGGLSLAPRGVLPDEFGLFDVFHTYNTLVRDRPKSRVGRRDVLCLTSSAL